MRARSLHFKVISVGSDLFSNNRENVMQQPYQPGYSQPPAGAQPLPPGFGTPYGAPTYQPHPQQYPPQQQPMMMYGGARPQNQPFAMERTAIVMVGSPNVGPFPCNVTCPNCRSQVTTIVSKKFNGIGWLVCLLLYLCTGFCCCLAFICDSNYDSVHSCPACGGFIAKYSSSD